MIYLAFFLPMAATRTLLVKAGLITDVGLASLTVMAVAVIVPLALERAVRGTVLRVLFVRPKAFHIATAANSFKTWTLIVPRSASSASTRSAFSASDDNKYSRTLVSKNTSGALIGLESVELE